MRTFHSYDDLWRRQPPMCPILEAFRGSDLVVWHGQIESALDDAINRYEGARNTEFESRLRAFKKVWTEHVIDGNINIETIEALLAASEVEAASDWEMKPFFRSLRDGLRKIKATEQELPRADAEPSMPAGGRPKGGGIGGPLFGPEDEKTPGGELPGETPDENAEPGTEPGTELEAGTEETPGEETETEGEEPEPVA